MVAMRAGSAELAATLDGVRSGMDVLHTHTIRSTTFKDTLLQLALAFHSGLSIDPATNAPIDLGNWVVKTGSIYNGITVLDDDSDVVLFETPGIFTTCDLKIDGGLHRIIEDASHNNSLMISTDRVYQEGLQNGSTLQLANGAQHIMGWYDIFRHYGYKMVVLDDAATGPVVTAVKEEEWGEGDLA